MDAESLTQVERDMLQRLDLLIVALRGLGEDQVRLGQAMEREFQKTRALILSLMHESNRPTFTRPLVKRNPNLR
jgi:hypothetical protein